MEVEKNRCVIDFIPELLKIIPNEETELIDKLTQYRDSLWNKAPEITRSYICWEPLQNILTIYVKEINTDWKRKMVKMFNKEE
jgi:hypothetical protein